MDGFEVITTSSPSWTPGSEGPGPVTLIEVGGSCARGSGTKAAREWMFKAGLSTKAFPAALRMNVYNQESFNIRTKERYLRGANLRVLVIYTT